MLREALGLSRASLAAVAQLELKYIARLERGEVDPPRSTLQRLAPEVLGVPASLLLDQRSIEPGPSSW